MNRFISFKSLLFALALCMGGALFGCAPAPVDQVDPPKKSAPGSDISGVWLLNVESPMGHEEIVARFQQTGRVLSGAMNAKGVDVPLSGGINGDAVQFDMTFDVRGNPLTLEYTGTVAGDAMEGTVKFGPMGTGRFSGHRTQ